LESVCGCEASGTYGCVCAGRGRGASRVSAYRHPRPRELLDLVLRSAVGRSYHPFAHRKSPILTHQPTDSFPSSTAFDLISASLSSPADRKSAIASGGAIFAFTLKNTASETDSWYIDLKETGTVGKGLAPEGKKPAVTLVLSDADFGKLVEGKANAQKLFMSGKLKVKGDVMKATKMETVLMKAKAQTGVKAKL
jgi:putative sterol carrier protein